jgi:hypothetical protein
LKAAGYLASRSAAVVPDVDGGTIPGHARIRPKSEYPLNNNDFLLALTSPKRNSKGRELEMSLPTVETILEDKNNNTVYTVVAFRRLTYDEMLTAVRQFYREKHTQRRTWLRNQSIRIVTLIGLDE